jgi:hypothetical protein
LVIADPRPGGKSDGAGRQSRPGPERRNRVVPAAGTGTAERKASFDAYGAIVRLTAECEDGRANLDRYAFPWLRRTQAEAAEPDLVVKIDRAQRRVSTHARERRRATFSESLGLVWRLIQALDEAVIGRLTTLCAVHAGAVEWNGRTLLFAGLAHVGKSALVAELLTRGAT